METFEIKSKKALVKMIKTPLIIEKDVTKVALAGERE